MSQISNCACAALFFCYLSTTVAHLLLDDVKQAAAHFDPFCVFKIPKIVDFSIQEKSGEVWKRNKQLSWKFLPRGADYAFYSFLFGKIQVSLTIKNLVCTIVLSDSEGLVARLFSKYLCKKVIDFSRFEDCRKLSYLKRQQKLFKFQKIHTIQNIETE